MTIYFVIFTSQMISKLMKHPVLLKKEVITKFENGVCKSDLAARYNIAKFTILAFLKKKEAIKAADVATVATIVHSKQRPKIMDKVENLLLI